MQAQVSNTSPVDVDILLSPVVSPEQGHKNYTDLASGQTRVYHVNTGTMKLTVRNKNGTILWQGPVPTFIKDPLIISDEGVSYQKVLLPSSISLTNCWTWWIVLGAILILIVLCVLLYLKKR